MILNSRLETRSTHCCNTLLSFIGPLWMLNSPILPSATPFFLLYIIVLSGSINFYLRDCVCVGWFFLCTGTRINFHWSIAFRGSSLSPSGLHPSSVSFFFSFASLSLFLSSSRTFFLHPPLFSSASICLSLPYSYPPQIVLSRRWFPRKGWRRSEKDADRRCTYVRTYVRTRVCVPWLGHGSLYQRVRFRVLPRVSGKPRTCHPSAETGRRRRSSVQFRLSPSAALRPLPASSHAGFFISSPLSPLTIPFLSRCAPCWY